MRFLRGSSTPQPPDSLLAQLRGASAAGDSEEFRAICRANQAAIVKAFSSWWPPKIESPEDPELNAYIQTVGQVAQVFATEFGNPELMEILTGPPETNPVAVITGELRAADDLLHRGQFEQVVERMWAVLEDLGKLKGTAVLELGAHAYGRLGQGYFGAGHVEEALNGFTYAAQAALENRDAEGVRVNTRERFECLRYLGRGEEAAEALEMVIQVGEQRGGESDLPWLRREAAIVRAGEPHNRVVAMVDDRHYELMDLKAEVKNGQAMALQPRFAHHRNRPQIPRAVAMTARGMWLASQGQLDDALAMLEAAAALDPFDPHPVYNAGFVLLELRRMTEAGVRFARTEELAPGWFLCRRYAWLVAELMAGRVPAEVVPILVATDDDDQPPARRLELLAAAAAMAPDLGWVSLSMAVAHQEAGRTGEAQRLYRLGLSQRIDDDVRSMLLVNLAVGLDGQAAEAQSLYSEAAGLERGHLTAVAIATLMLAHN